MPGKDSLFGLGGMLVAPGIVALLTACGGICIPSNSFAVYVSTRQGTVGN